VDIARGADIVPLSFARESLDPPWVVLAAVPAHRLRNPPVYDRATKEFSSEHSTVVRNIETNGIPKISKVVVRQAIESPTA
jgi:hypothetical protein